MKTQIVVGSVVAFNTLDDATWFDVIAIDGHMITIRERGTEYAEQLSDISLVKQIKPDVELEPGTNTRYYDLEKLVVQFVRTEPEANLRVKLVTFIERRMGVDEVTDLAAFLGISR